MAIHIVQQGDHFSGIAHQYGFRDYQTIWNHPQNQALRKERSNPHVLYPGDQVFIPDKVNQITPASTGQRHRFKLSGKRLKLRLAVKDWNGKPIKNTPCTLVVEKQSYELVTDGEGIVSQDISPDAKVGKLSIQNMEISLLIGHLDPVDLMSGWRERLNNLGYNAGDAEAEDDSKLRSAIEQFQHDHDLFRDGVCGPKTQAALLKVHGS